MNRMFKLFVVPFLVLFLFVGGAMAENITIWDGIVAIGDSPPVGDGEKGEVEPGMQTRQAWWLESFALDGNHLSATGYFDFKNGFGGEAAGDIFVAVGEAPEYGTGSNDGVLNFGYGYVFDINWVGKSYSVYELYPGADLVMPNVPKNDPRSAPYNFNPELSDAAITDYDSRSFSIDSTGDLYTASSFDMSFLGTTQKFWAHLTLSCGNDSMMGLGATHAPEPTTMLLLGTGLIGMAGVSRKKFKN